MTKPEDYTVEQFIKEIRAIIEANPDNVNALNKDGSECVYEDAEGNNCVIGKFLHNVGLLEKLDIVDENGNRIGISKDGGHEWTKALDVLPALGFSDGVSGLAHTIQSRADSGISWKSLLEYRPFKGVETKPKA